MGREAGLADQRRLPRCPWLRVRGATLNNNELERRLDKQAKPCQQSVFSPCASIESLQLWKTVPLPVLD